MAKKETTGKVRILKQASADRADTRDTAAREQFARNPHGRDNVNVAQGPRTGNEGAHKAKRVNFLDAKAERAPLADVITNAFAAREARLTRNGGQNDLPESGSIKANSQIERFKRSKSKYTD